LCPCTPPSGQVASIALHPHPSKTLARESLGLYELKQHNPWFDGECLGFLDQRKQAKMQWIKVPSQSNVNNLNNLTCKTSRYFRNKKKEYLKAKIDDVQTNSTMKNITHLYRSLKLWHLVPLSSKP